MFSFCLPDDNQNDNLSTNPDLNDVAGMRMNTKTGSGVASVNRALSILMAFEDGVEGMSLTELSTSTGLYHSTILRICQSLEHYGFINRLDDGRFMLGSTPFYLGMLYQDSFRLSDYVVPVLRQLVRATKETAAIYIREGNSRVCLHRMSQPRSVRMHVREGERVELDKGAAGKVLLAFSNQRGHDFDQIRAAHFAVSLSETGSESAAIACPIFSARQRLTCSISLGIPLFRFNQRTFDAFLPLVMEAARTLTKKLGGDASVFMPPYQHLEKLVLPSS